MAEPPSEPPPFQALDQRLLGEPIDDTLYVGVPDWLVSPLRSWIAGALSDLPDGSRSLAQRVAMRLRWSLGGAGSYGNLLINSYQDDLLRVVDAVLQLHPMWHEVHNWGSPTGQMFKQHFEELDRLLVDGASELTVSIDSHRLERRIDPTVRKLADAAVRAADDVGADHLRRAWAAAYGLAPSPDGAYDEAVRAVESVACPLIVPNADGRRTLGTVIRDLRSQKQFWQLVFPDQTGSAAEVEPLLAMLDLLWQGQLSRHAGSTKSRRQTQAEAEAAVHLAGTLVHWLTTGVLSKR